MKKYAIEKLVDAFGVEYENLYKARKAGTAEELEEFDRLCKKYPAVIRLFNSARQDFITSDRECAAFVRAFYDNAAELIALQLKANLANEKPRSAWGRGVKDYAFDLLDDLQNNGDAGVYSNQHLLRKALLNGASDWNEYSAGGCSLIFDGDIAARLCTVTEYKRTDGGRKAPNPRESWIDVQARALFQAAEMVIRAAF